MWEMNISFIFPGKISNSTLLLPYSAAGKEKTIEKFKKNSFSFSVLSEGGCLYLYFWFMDIDIEFLLLAQ